MLIWRGALSIVAGLLLLVFPMETATAVGLLVGAWLVIDGVSTAALSFQQRAHAASWGSTMFSGIVTAVAGVAVLLFPVAFAVIGSMAVLWITALGIVLTGIAKVSAHNGWSLLLGLVNIIFGVLLGGLALADPAGGLVSLAWVFGIYGLVAGILSLVIGIRLRRHS